jgi:hypothetical protein
VIAGVAMATAIVNGLSPDQSRPFDAGKAATIVAAAVVWLFSEIGGRKAPSASDVALYQRIKALMDESALSFLQQHDFGASIRDSQIVSVGEICLWHGADTEFRDPKIQKEWRDCRAKLGVLNRLYVEKLYPTNNPGRLSAIPPETDDWNTPQHLLDAVGQLNSSASEAYESFNSFDRIARNRLDL